MDTSTLLDMWRSALEAAASIGAPFLLAALLVGLIASLIQAATQMNENILSFVPKLIAVGLVMSLGGNWLFDRINHYTANSIRMIEKMDRRSAVTSVTIGGFLAAFARSSAFFQTAPLTGDRIVPLVCA